MLALGLIAIAAHLIGRSYFPTWADWPLLAVIFLGSWPLLFQILIKIYHRDIGADVLAFISIIAAFILKEYLACLLVIMMLALGQALEAYALRRASSVLKILSTRMPRRVFRKSAQGKEEIDLTEVVIGDLLMVFPHEASPVDGVVVQGHGFMDESYLTGEPYRIAKAVGSKVISGAINGDSLLMIRAEKLPKDSRFAQIIKVMEEAEQKRPKLRRLGDQLGAIFAPISLMVAIGAWILTQDPIRFLSVLVIATPCPLLIAIPVALISAISIAARRGIIIKDPVVLERIPTCKTAIFDKTGTLTYGQPSLSEMVLAPGFDRREVLESVASLEQYSKHPLAHAIIDAAHGQGITLREADRVEERPGHGLTGQVSGLDIEVTSRQKAIDMIPDLKDRLVKSQAGLECVIIIDHRYAATMIFRDEPRSDSLSFITHLGPFHNFDRVMLLSGDRESEVRYLADELGITEMLFSKTPEEKLEIVRAETKKAQTLFMGDGINDAPALKAATVGIAFGQPTASARESSGAVIMDKTMLKVDELLHLSIDMRKIALQSAIGGMALSFLGMGFAASGFITPVAGALVQQAIDAVAILNALRLTFKRKVKVDLPH